MTFTMKEIPKPPKKKLVSEDKRKKYLEKWKELFESLHSEVKVYLYFDEKFREVFDSIIKINFEFALRDPRILILVPKELNYFYIIGAKGNRMFSDEEVRKDEYFHEEGQIGDDCMPKTFTWKYFYELLYNHVESIKKTDVPAPPTTH